MSPPARSPAHPFRAVGYYFHIRVFPSAKNLHQSHEKVDQRALFLVVSFLSPRAQNAVRGIAVEQYSVAGEGSMRSGSSGARAPFSLNPQQYALPCICLRGKTIRAKCIFSIFRYISDHGTEHPLLTEPRCWFWWCGLGRVLGRRSLGGSKKSDQFLVVHCSYREG